MVLQSRSESRTSSSPGLRPSFLRARTNILKLKGIKVGHERKNWGAGTRTGPNHTGSPGDEGPRLSMCHVSPEVKPKLGVHWCPSRPQQFMLYLWSPKMTSVLL